MTTSTPPNATVRLDDLIAAITSAHDDVLEQLSNALLLAERLDEVADQLIGHFVDQARHSGASWTEIGRSMGVTKQAVQKRFSAKPAGLDPSAGFSQYTDRARMVVVTAQKEAADRRERQHLHRTPAARAGQRSGVERRDDPRRPGRRPRRRTPGRSGQPPPGRRDRPGADPLRPARPGRPRADLRRGGPARPATGRDRTHPAGDPDRRGRHRRTGRAGARGSGGRSRAQAQRFSWIVIWSVPPGLSTMLACPRASR